MPFFCVYSCILYTKTSKCQFFNKVFGRYAAPLPFFSRSSGWRGFLTGLRKNSHASVKSPFCGTSVLLYCKYAEGRQPLPHQLEKRYTLCWKRDAHYERKQLCGKDHLPRPRQLRGTYRELFCHPERSRRILRSDPPGAKRSRLTIPVKTFIFKTRSAPRKPPGRIIWFYI